MFFFIYLILRKLLFIKINKLRIIAEFCFIRIVNLLTKKNDFLPNIENRLFYRFFYLP